MPKNVMELEWHGWRVAGDPDAVHVGRAVPSEIRKLIQLYRVTGGEERILAFFRSEEDAAWFLRWLDEMIAIGYKYADKTEEPLEV